VVVKLAILMPAYNSARFIAPALGSLLRQRDAARLDIIVVDDGSTDGTREVVRSLAEQAPEIRLIEAPHRGISASRNAALDAIAPDADLVSMLDSDDLSPPGRFKRDLVAFAQDPELDLHYGYTRYFIRIGEGELDPDPRGPSTDLRGVHLGASIIRPSLIARIGRFNEALNQAEDTDFLFRMFDLKPLPRIALTSEICVYYRQHDGNTTGDVSAMLGGLTRAIAARLSRARRGEASALPQGFFADLERFKNMQWLSGRKQV
jgi:glycosyltransferase involved in cell wall biosynthesis